MFAFEDSDGEYDEDDENTVKVDKTKDHALLSLLGEHFNVLILIDLYF